MNLGNRVAVMGAPDKSPENSNSSTQRVKVYRLTEDGKWADQGTGHISVDYVERSEDLGLFVIEEDDNEILLVHRICSDDIYRKQEETIISWKDSKFSTELALSFQEAAGCSYIWDHICSVQRNLHFNHLSSTAFDGVNSELRELPAVGLSTLPLVLKIMTESRNADQMHLTGLILNDQDFFRKLMEVFRMCEDLENIDGLHMIFKIVKGIISLNNPQIFEKIFSDELIMDIIGSLEFDPEAPNVQCHRNFLKEHVVFKEAIPIQDHIVLSKIHQTYRVGYLKDVVLPRALDEGTVANLNSIIQSNNSIVLSSLKNDSTFIQELFVKLRSPNTSAESKKKLVLFLNEFCSLSKSLQMVQQHHLYKDLMNEGIFDIISDALQSPDKSLVLTGTDILILFVNQDPNLLRTFVVGQEGSTLFGLLVKGMLTDFGDDMHCQFVEILRSLLDSSTLTGSQRDTIIDIFYERHLCELIDVITSSCPVEGDAQSSSNSVVSGGRVDNQNNVKPEILSNICDLLCFCVQHHPYRIKCNFLPNNVIEKVLFLTRRKEKYLVASAVRFLRTLLSRHDENLTSHIAKYNLLKPVVEVFIANGNRYNLLNSAVLELFEFIRKENLKSLVKYLIDSFWDELVKFENFASIHNLKVKYDQSLDDGSTVGTENGLEPRKRNDDRGLDKEEEDYFNEDSPKSGGLVDYEDDEDDEDYRPPPKKLPETSDPDDGILESFKLKRKMGPTNMSRELTKKARLDKKSKSKDNVFSALCSTLSQAVLPNSKNTAIPAADISSDEEIQSEEEYSGERNGSDDIIKPSEEHSPKENNNESSEKKELGIEDCPSIIPQESSSPELAANGS